MIRHETRRRAGSRDVGAHSLRVLLLPGIWMPALSLSVMARRLQDAGFVVRLRGYSGVLSRPEVVQYQLRQALADVDAVVAHSLGGLMALEALRIDPHYPVRRVVCLGSPVCGSAVARRLRHGNLRYALGASAELLSSGLHHPPPHALQVAMIAGSRARGIGRVLGGVPSDGDGTVGLDETRSPWLRDHLVIAATHTGLLFSSLAADQAAHFLQHGQFARPE